jgi:hypothetical protein
MATKYSDDPTIEEMLCEVYGHDSVKTTRIYMNKNIEDRKIFMEECGNYLEE